MLPRQQQRQHNQTTASALPPRPASTTSALRFVPGTEWPPPKPVSANSQLQQQERLLSLPLPPSVPAVVVCAAAAAAASSSALFPPSAPAPAVSPTRPKEQQQRLSPPHSPERLRAPRSRRSSTSSSSAALGGSHRRVSAARRLCPAFEAAALREEQEEESEEEAGACAPSSSCDEEQGGAANASPLSPRTNGGDLEQGSSDSSSCNAFSPSALLRSLLSSTTTPSQREDQPPAVAERPLVSLAAALAPPPPPPPVAVVVEEGERKGHFSISPSSSSLLPAPRLSEAEVGVVVASLARQLARVHAAGKVHRRVCASAVLVSRRGGGEGGEGENDSENRLGRKSCRKSLLLPAFSSAAASSSSIIRLAPAAPGGRLPRDGRPLLGPKVAVVAAAALSSASVSGTPHPAPEIARSREGSGNGSGGSVRHAPPSDVWSLGVLAAGLLSGAPRGAAPPFALPGALLAAAATENSNDRDFSAGAATTTTTTRGGSRSPRSSADADELQRWVDRSLARCLDSAGLPLDHPARGALAAMLRVDPAQRPTAAALSLSSLSRSSSLSLPSSSSFSGIETEAEGSAAASAAAAARRWLRGALDAAGVELRGEDEVVAVRAPSLEEKGGEKEKVVGERKVYSISSSSTSCSRIPLSLFPAEPSSGCCAAAAAAAAAPLRQSSAAAAADAAAAFGPRRRSLSRAASSSESELDAETLDALRKLWLCPSSRASSATVVLPSSSAPTHGRRSWASAVGAALDVASSAASAPLLAGAPAASSTSLGALSWLSRLLPRGDAASVSNCAGGGAGAGREAEELPLEEGEPRRAFCFRFFLEGLPYPGLTRRMLFLFVAHPPLLRDLNPFLLLFCHRSSSEVSLCKKKSLKKLRAQLSSFALSS